MSTLAQYSYVPIDVQGDFPTWFPEDSHIKKGTLYLFKPANSKGYDSPEPPKPGTLLPNVGWRAAADILKAGDRSSLSMVVEGTYTAEQVKTEITAKKGLHIMTSQTKMTAAKGFFAKLPPLIAAYILANSENHQFFFRLIEKITRSPSGFNDRRLGLEANSGPSSNYLALMRSDTSLPTSGAKRLGGRLTQGGNLTGYIMRNIGVSGFTGSRPADGTVLTSHGLSVGPAMGFSSVGLNASASTVLYEFEIEDLTVTGRTYAEADAEALAYFNEVTGPGGRYAADTHSDPATVLP